jgi:hypothetical protein
VGRHRRLVNLLHQLRHAGARGLPDCMVVGLGLGYVVRHLRGLRACRWQGGRTTAEGRL